MTDWTKATGRTGTMMIRDTGTTVEFWLKAAADTYNYYGVPWRYKVNGVLSSRKTVFPTGGNWVKCGSWNVTKDQTVYFYLGKSGTTGLGGPTTFSHKITRTSVPPKPTLRITSWTDTTVNANADSNGNGGISLDRVQLGYSTTSSPSSYKDLDLSNGTGKVTGLTRGKTYYFRARVHNSKGWSGWSNRVKIRMKSGPSAPAKPVITDVTQQTVYFKMAKPFDGGSAITGYRIGYSTSSSGPSSYIDWNTALTRGVYHLTPGQTYYFWAQAKNAYGNSAWSLPVKATLLAGSYVNVGSTKKRAVPYVRSGGTWHIAQPWVKHGGVWKKTK